MVAPDYSSDDLDEEPAAGRGAHRGAEAVRNRTDLDVRAVGISQAGGSRRCCTALHRLPSAKPGAVADEVGQLERRGAILEEAPSALGQWKLDRPVPVVPRQPVPSEPGADLAAVEAPHGRRDSRWPPREVDHDDLPHPAPRDCAGRTPPLTPAADAEAARRDCRRQLGT